MKSSLILNSPYTSPSHHWKFVEENAPLEQRRVENPFELGDNSRIAVKIVDYGGVESLRIKEVDKE